VTEISDSTKISDSAKISDSTKQEKDLKGMPISGTMSYTAKSCKGFMKCTGSGKLDDFVSILERPSLATYSESL